MTNHVHWPTNVSVTIRKGDYQVTLGPKEKPKAVQIVPTPEPMPPPAKEPWTSQEIAFILVVSVAIMLAGRWLYKLLPRSPDLS